MESLKTRWQALKSEGKRIRDAAQELGTTEAALLETGLGESVRRLAPDFDALLKGLAACGKVKAITRNDACVHEEIGEYLGFKRVHGPIAILNNPRIDLRLFLNHWAHAYAVHDSSHGRELLSLQFFDEFGEALHKVYLTERSDRDAYEALVAAHLADDQSARDFPPAQEEGTPTPSEFDREALLEVWRGLKDTHDFNKLLRKFRVSRTDAIKAAEGEFTQALGQDAARKALEWASTTDNPIMVFVGNHGAIQIHSGPAKKVVDARGWLNVMDPEFNLHVMEALLAESWVVRKPTSDGYVHSIECFDAQGEVVVQFFGVRKPGQEESAAWRDLVDSLS